MFRPHKDFLSLFGWDSFFESQIAEVAAEPLFPARVICEERELYRVQAGQDITFWASVSGKMRFNAASRADYPAVGDWVMVELSPQADRGVIHQVCARKNMIHRRQVGASGDMQILSANVDYVFVTTSLNEDLNLRRLERYMAMVWESGSQPVVLLTKADLCTDEAGDLALRVEVEFPGVPVHLLSKDEFAAADFFAGYLQPGITAIVVGSSGVGKSTLVNFLIGSDEIKTQDIRDDDGKGRHTTTSRHLYISRFGGLIIDTPGMRELQLSDHADGLETQFADIEELGMRCRFRDCRHHAEPGCGIKNALLSGELSDARWKSYLKLKAEIRHQMRKQNKALASADKKAWKKLSLMAQQRDKMKKRNF